MGEGDIGGVHEVPSGGEGTEKVRYRRWPVPCVLNSIRVAQPQEYEYGIPPG